MGGRRWWALAAIVLSVLTIGLDATILNIALPTLADSLNASNSQLQWLVDAYVLVYAGLLLPAGAVGDRYGRKKVLMVGLALFGLASAGALFTDSPTQLIVIRALLGVGAAILTPITLAVLPVLFAPDEQGRAITLLTLGTGLGIPLGPLIGGYLLEHFWWGSIFLVNIPAAAIGLIAVALLIPESRDPAARPVDWLGAALSTVGLVAIVYAIVEVPERGWGSLVVLAGLLGGAAVLAGFVVWQRFAKYPMVDVSLFGERRFLWGSVLATLASFALFGLLFVLPQYLQAVRGNDAFGTGLRLLPVMAGMLVGTRVAGPLVSRVGDKIPATVGMGLLALGLAAGATTTLGTGFGAVAAWLGLVGFGLGVALPAAMHAVLGSLRVDKAGVGSAMTMTFRQVGGALGVAVLGSALASAYRDRLPAGAPALARDSVSAGVAVARRLGNATLLHAVDASYLHAMAVVLLVCAAVCLLGSLLAALLLPAHASGAPAAPPSGALPADRAAHPRAVATSRGGPGEEESTHESARSA
jgi:EmrB/QacA subfamily drug resistance transporter